MRGFSLTHTITQFRLAKGVRILGIDAASGWLKEVMDSFEIPSKIQQEIVDQMLVRNALAVTAVITCVTCALFLATKPATSGIIADRPFNDLTAAGIQLKLSQSEQAFELALVAFAGLWALVLAKKDEAKIVLGDNPELVMFTCANVLLVGSVVSYFVYVQDINYVYEIAGRIEDKGVLKRIPDIFGSKLNRAFQSQLWMLFSGLIITCITLVSAHRLKPHTLDAYEA
jgi:hypothetical protein